MWKWFETVTNNITIYFLCTAKGIVVTCSDLLEAFEICYLTSLKVRDGARQCHLEKFNYF